MSRSPRFALCLEWLDSTFLSQGGIVAYGIFIMMVRPFLIMLSRYFLTLSQQGQLFDTSFTIEQSLSIGPLLPNRLTDAVDLTGLLLMPRALR